MVILILKLLVSHRISLNILRLSLKEIIFLLMQYWLIYLNLISYWCSKAWIFLLELDYNLTIVTPHLGFKTLVMEQLSFCYEKRMDCIFVVSSNKLFFFWKILLIILFWVFLLIWILKSILLNLSHVTSFHFIHW